MFSWGRFIVKLVTETPDCIRMRKCQFNHQANITCPGDRETLPLPLASNHPILDAVQTQFTLIINLDSQLQSCKVHFLGHCLSVKVKRWGSRNYIMIFSRNTTICGLWWRVDWKGWSIFYSVHSIQRDGLTSYTQQSQFHLLLVFWFW